MKIVLEVRSQVYLQVNNFVTTYYSPFFVRWSSRAWTKGWLLRGVWLLCLLVFVCLTIKVIGSQKSWWAVFVNQSCSINILTSKLQLWSVNIFVLSIVKQLGVTPDVRGVTAGPAMMQLNQVSLRKVLQLKMFPGLSYLVVAASPRQGCLLERRRCWGVGCCCGWCCDWCHETWGGSNILQVSQKHQTEHANEHHISPPYCFCPLPLMYERRPGDWAWWKWEVDI